MAERIDGHLVTYTANPWLIETEAVIGQIAARKLPGITATIGGTDVEPGGTHVVIQATAEGEEWLSRLSRHPLTEAANLLVQAADDRRIARKEAGHSRYLAPEVSDRGNVVSFSWHLRRAAADNTREAAEILRTYGYLTKRPTSRLPFIRALIERAADELLHPPVSVAAPGSGIR